VAREPEHTVLRINFRRPDSAASLALRTPITLKLANHFRTFLPGIVIAGTLSMPSFAPVWLGIHPPNAVAAFAHAGTLPAILPAILPGTLPAAAPADALRALAERQKSEPDAAVRTLPPPAGVDAAAVAELPEAERAPGSPALWDLKTTLDQLAPVAAPAQPAEEPPLQPQPEPLGEDAGAPDDADARWQALRKYIAGRDMLASNDLPGAIAELQAAAQLDPSAARTWRVLGEAQLAAGRRTAAAQSLREALRRGDRDIRTRWLVGRDLLRSGRADEAATFLALAYRELDGNQDPAMKHLVPADLGEALVRSRRALAGAEALREGLDLPRQFSKPTRLREELGELFRRRADLHIALGDAMCGLARYEDALIAYETAADLPALDPGAARARRMFALLKLGRSADVALRLIEDARAAAGRVDERQIAMLRQLGIDAAGPRRDITAAIESELARLDAELPATTPPSVRVSLIRARAAVLPAVTARALLENALIDPRLPTGLDDLFDELLRALSAATPAERVQAAVRIAELQPRHAPRLARALLSSGLELPSIRRELNAGTPPAAGIGALLLSVSISDLLGRPGEALAVFDRGLASINPGTNAPALGALAAEFAAGAGEWARARREVDRVRAIQPSGPDLAQALRAVQDFSAALEAIRPTLGDQPAPFDDAAKVEHLLRAADFAQRAGKPELAEAFLQRARAADPFDERSYEALIALFGQGGPRADQAKLSATFRLARESLPTGRSLRRLSAQEMLSRGAWAQAEPVLAALADEEPATPGFIELLVASWEQQARAGDAAAASRGRDWLQARRAARPAQPWLITGIARMLAAEGKGTEAESLLAAALDEFGSPELARTRERVVRETLKDPARAARLALERLRDSAGERGVESTLELVDILLTNGSGAEAADALEARVPRELTLTREQLMRLLNAATKGVSFIRDANADIRRGPDALGVARVLDAIEARGLTLASPLLSARLALLASNPNAPGKKIHDAAAALRTNDRRQGERAVAAVVTELIRSDDRAAVLRLCRAIVLHAPAPDPETAWDWVVACLEFGTLDDLRDLVRSMPAPEPLTTVISRMPIDDDGVRDETWLRAQFAYALSNTVSLMEKLDDAKSLLRLALEIRPDHAWAANNLGYSLLEADTRPDADLREAEELLIRAWATLSNNHHVIDSMGWLRFRQGRIADELNADGVVIREGALTLLRRAVELSPEPSAEGIDHLADALWVSGDRNGAITRWNEAIKIASDDIAGIPRVRNEDRMVRAFIERNQKQIVSVRAKLDAAQRGDEPALDPHGKR
jgi:hypothetical protein